MTEPHEHIGDDVHQWSAVSCEASGGIVFYCTQCRATETLAQRLEQAGRANAGRRRLAAGLAERIRDLSLTRTERQILSRLLLRLGEVVTSDELSTVIWGYPADAHLRAALRSHIYSLRRKMHAVNLDCTLETRPGEGVRLVGPSDVTPRDSAAEA